MKIVAILFLFLCATNSYCQYLDHVSIDTSITISRDIVFNYKILIPSNSGNNISISADKVQLSSTDEVIFKDGFTASATNINFEFSSSIQTCPYTNLFINVNNVTCPGGSDGSINLSILNSHHPKLYDWQSHLSFDSTNSNLIAGTYLFRIIDFGGCRKDSTLTIIQPDYLKINPIVTYPDCGSSNGTIVLHSSGGSGGYLYHWINDNLYDSVRVNLSSGQYSVTVSDQSGCSETKQLILTVNNFGDSLYSLESSTVCPKGFTEIFTDSSIKSIILPDGVSKNHISAGSYVLYLIDTNNCIYKRDLLIEESIPITYHSTISKPSCNENNGRIELDSIQCNSSYSITWSPMFSDSTTLYNIPAGQYYATFIDSFQCVYTYKFNLETSSVPAIVTDSVIIPRCFNSRDGYIKLHSLNSNVTYKWNDLEESVSERNNLFGGLYKVQVKDNYGCTAYYEFNLNSPDQFNVNITTTPSACNSNSGKAFIRTSGGTPPYSYNFHGYQIDGNIKNLTASIDTILISDSKGCSIAKTFEVESSGGPIVSDSIISPISQNGSSNGTIVILPSGSNEPFRFFWPEDSSTTQIKNNLHAGRNIVYVSDNIGCTTKYSFTVSEPERLLFYVKCTFDSLIGWKGKIEIVSGNPPYTIFWDSVCTNSFSRDSLNVGVHSVEIIDHTQVRLSQNFSLVWPFPDQPRLSCANIPVWSECPGRMCTRDIVLDFGADPTGVLNSDCAFQRASAYFNSLHGGGTLFIPPGNYKVGEQFNNYNNSPNGYAREGLHVFPLYNCSNFNIVGLSDANGNPPVIRFDDCLFYGTFSSNFTQRQLSGAGLDNGINTRANLASVGSFILFKDCSRMGVSNIEINGNATNLSIGGHWQDGIQVVAGGIFLINTYRSNFSNLNIHNCGQDGVSMYMENPITLNNNFNDCHFDWNNRVGFYWAGGKNATFNRCTFNNNSVGRISSKAGDGIDLELWNNQVEVENGIFNDCQFMWNDAAGVESSPNSPGLVAHHTFTNCTLACYNQKYSSWARGRDFTFYDCIFYGPVNGAWNDYITTGVHSDNIKFLKQRQGPIGCEFRELFDGLSINHELGEECDMSPVNPSKHWLVDFSLGASGALFQNSYFTSNRKMRLFNVLGGPDFSGTNGPNNNIIFRDCTGDQFGVWNLPVNIGTINNGTIILSRMNTIPGQVGGIYYQNCNGVFQTFGIHSYDPNACQWNLDIPYFPDRVEIGCNFCTIYRPLYCPADCNPCNSAKYSTEHETSEIEIIPNPATSSIILKGDFKSLNIAIYNSIGRVVLQRTGINPGDELELRNFDPGVYFIKNSIGLSKKIIIL